MDVRSLYDRELPEDLSRPTTPAILTPNFFVEAQYSQRDLSFDRRRLATHRPRSRARCCVDSAAAARRYWSPTFCAVCAPPEQRDNEDILVKGNYFLSTGGSGSHSLVFGYDTFNDVRFANNHQSGSDYRILGTTSIIRGRRDLSVMAVRHGSTQIQWNPITPEQPGHGLPHALGLRERHVAPERSPHV